MSGWSNSPQSVSGADGWTHFPPNTTGGGGGSGTVTDITSVHPALDATPNPITGSGTLGLLPFIGDSGSGGTEGIVPAPAIGDASADKFLHADGTWQTPAGGGGPMYARGTWTNGGFAIDATTAPRIYVYFPTAGTITGVSLLTNGGTGSCVVDIIHCVYANFPTMSSIAAAAKPTITSNVKYLDTTLTGWTTAVSAGDILGFELESSSVFTSIFAQVEVTP